MGAAMQAIRISWYACSILLMATAIGVGGCEDDAVGQSLTFVGEDPLFSGFSYDTGLVPDGASVQASFSLTAQGAIAVKAEATPSGSAESPTLTGTPETGEVGVAGSFGMEGRLVIDISGLPSYDGPIPGIENVLIEFGSASAFNPFSIGTPVASRTDIPPARLPSIPLPGGIPGSLVLEVAEGSFVEATLTGTSACVASNEARYAVSLDRAGTLIIAPLIEIEVPLLGTQTFEIPSFEVPLTLVPTVLTMRADVASFGAQPEVGDHVAGVCSGDPSVGGNTGSGGSAATGGTGGSSSTDCTSPDDCGGLPCVEGTCSPGGGICDANITIGDGSLDMCISMSCCEHLETCTYGYDDIDGCNTCIMNGGGDRCDGLLTCIDAACGGWTCDIANYGTADGCDCGCGIVDPDCVDGTVGSCEYCNNTGSCSVDACPGTIDPNDNAVCL